MRGISVYAAMIVKIGIIGAGVFGNYHAQKIALNEHAKLVGFYDANSQKSSKRAKAHNCQFFLELQTLLDRVDAVIIASPASAHYNDGLRALKAGKHCLIEKPLATCANEAENLIQIAEAKNLVLQVGHQERFVLKAIGIDKIKVRPLSIKTQRFSPFSPRGTDISVTLDLMIHDIDLAIWLMGSSPDLIKSYSHSLVTDQSDMSLAFLDFGVGKARLDANRDAVQSKRKLSIEYPQGRIQLDFLTKICENTTPFGINEGFITDMRAQDPLRAADDAYISAIRNGTPICVTGQDGLIALQTALKIDHSAP